MDSDLSLRSVFCLAGMIFCTGHQKLPVDIREKRFLQTMGHSLQLKPYHYQVSQVCLFRLEPLDSVSKCLRIKQTQCFGRYQVYCSCYHFFSLDDFNNQSEVKLQDQSSNSSCKNGNHERMRSLRGEKYKKTVFLYGTFVCFHVISESSTSLQTRNAK